MKSSLEIFDTICRKCDNSAMYSWYCVDAERVGSGIAFDIHDKETDAMICCCSINCHKKYIEKDPDWPIGYVTFFFYNGRDSVTFDVQDYKCELGSIYMNDIIDMAIKVMNR